MLESWNVDPLKNNFNANFFVKKFWRASQFLEIFKRFSPPCNCNSEM